MVNKPLQSRGGQTTTARAFWAARWAATRTYILC